MTTNPKWHKPLWHLVDAKDQIVGRLATQLVHVLRGKHKPSFQPNADCGDYIVVINASEIKFTGKKVDQKEYIWHTGYPGGLKRKNVKKYLEEKPEEILRKAVFGMMPNNKLRSKIMTKIRIFPGEKHLHEDKLPLGTPPVNVTPEDKVIKDEVEFNEEDAITITPEWKKMMAKLIKK